MDRTEATAALCELMAQVNETVFRCEGPADCICPDHIQKLSNYQNDGRAIEFIRAAVRAAFFERDKIEAEYQLRGY